MRRSLTRLWTPQPEGVLRKVSAANAETADFTSANGLKTVYADSAETTDPMVLSLTPTLDCWWPVNCAMLVRAMTAAWGDLSLALVLSPADADGVTRQAARIIHHSTTAGYVNVGATSMWKLAAATAYTCTMKIQATTGGVGWRYLCRAEDLYMFSTGVIPR